MADDDPPPTAERDRIALALRRTRFEALIEVPAAQREAWLAAHVDDGSEREALRRWLDIDAASGFLDTPATERAARLADDEIRGDSLLGTQIGAFTLVRSLGSGGMATVFLGRRSGADFEQTVAIKLLRRGLYSELEQRLFQRERRVLAGLEHPSIARLIDGGINAAGVPYLVMEFVDGVPITQFADDHALDTVQRLHLFLAVCQAVEAAHRNLVVHRDIKPSNILVRADGVVKLLDFGIAKLIEDEGGDATATIGVFTPHYAAPEQLSGDAITTATDVYGLGVLLHELLLGMRPSGSPTRRPSSRVNDRPATASPRLPAARLRKLLRGDLDNILLKALAEEPGRRYASAGALADDVARYLQHQPVAAHPPSRLYRLSRFVRRHRAGVAFGAAFVLALIAALAFALWQAQLAHREAMRANTVRGFFEDMFAPIDNGLIDAKQQSVHDLLANATGKLGRNTELRAAERIDLQLMFSRLHEKVGEPEQAQALATQAAQLADAELPRDDPLALDAQISRAYALAESNKAEEAEPLLKAIDARVGGSHAIDGMPRVRLLDGLADIADRKGEHDSALAYERRALAERIAKFGADDRQTANGYNNVAISLDLSGHHDEAIEAFQHAYAIQLAQAGPDSFDTAIARENLGHAELLAGRLRDAGNDLIAVEPLFEAPPNNKRNRNVYYWQSRCQLALARGTLADGACAHALAATRELLGSDAGWNARALRLDAWWKLESGDPVAARAALAASAPLLRPDGYAPWRGQLDYLVALIDFVEARPAPARDGFARAIDALGREYPETLRLIATSLRALACGGGADPGSDCATEAAAARREIDARPDADNVLLLPAQIALARIDLSTAQAAAAATRLRRAIDAAEREVTPQQIHLLEARLWLAAADSARGDCARAASGLALVRPLLAANHLDGHPLLAAARSQLRADAACRLERSAD